MKKVILLLMLTTSLFTISCNNDDSTTNNNNEVYQKLLGKWYHGEPSPDYNSALTFNSNGTVKYTYWTGSGNNYDSETGTFSVEGDVMTMVFPETVTLIFVQKVVFVNADKVDFQSTGNPNEEAYEGFWFRAEE
ncbi:hypothetical protein [Flavobacterium sp. NRK1]|uniref:hypothetical protein n=1 Tax=Flavobacterium sp. NRK1 TaxID=2954929 RepID=UPI0020927D3F|nr:hypothetical protein [Flavobacterium sp. NRK1]MCO6147393.1 hypothetical protein [Flavobacterium sp. NRK1]